MMQTPDDLILAMLAAEPQHGAALLEAFEDPARLAHVWYMNSAQIHAVLKRLERDGWTEPAPGEQENSPQTDYRITPTGRSRLRDWLSETELPATISDVRLDFLSRVYAARLLNEPVGPLAARQAAVCAAERGRLAALLETTDSDFARSAITLDIVHVEAVMIWLLQSFGPFPTT
jgi:DNA-binding PadR family transcriptional regulator